MAASSCQRSPHPGALRARSSSAQSAEGAIAGGATNSWQGRYATPPAGTPTFHGLYYDEKPVYHD
ncbi:glycoside hydrolase family 48 protein, partial [Streptomyces ficellus]